MKLLNKIGAAVFAISIVAVSVVAPVSAHVVVKPGEVLTGSRQTFTVGVPNEQEQPYVAVKLNIPKGVTNVMPFNKQGWVISVEKSGEGETAKVTSISWTEGSVGSGIRDGFDFSAKAPDTAAELQWKAYQTYADGSVVSWDQEEKPASATSHESSDSGPFSVTKVVSETEETAAANQVQDDVDSAKSTAKIALYSAVAALAVALVIFAYRVKTK